MKKKIIFILSTFLIITVCVLGYIAVVGQNYTMYLSDSNNVIKSVETSIKDESVAQFTGFEHKNGYACTTFKGLSKGQTDVTIKFFTDTGEENQWVQNLQLDVTTLNVVKSSTSGFNGWEAVLVGESLFFIIMSVFFFLHYKQKLKSDLYSYNTSLDCGVLIVCIGMAAMFVAAAFVTLSDYMGYTSNTMMEITSEIMNFFVILSFPFVFIFAIAISISNISLIRHEGFRPVNMLGMAISVMFILGVLFLLFMQIFNSIMFQNGMGTIKIDLTFRTIYSAVFGFLESLLLGTMITALIAAKHKPAYNKDFIIMLGCGIRKDGTLLPLLKGRVDRAIQFYNEQFKATGKKAVFVPSGGQGSDEIISEGEAMKRYLVENGIPEEQIMPETKSTTTLENMKFSKKLIDNVNKDANVVFSTTNYHVYRSGIFSAQAGLKAEGIGSKTKWYFWPNAFMREFIGLVVTSWKKELLFFGAIAVMAALVANFESIMSIL